MLNGRFENFQIFQVNSSSMSFDQRFKDKATLECWVRPDDQEEKDYLDLHGGFMITPDRPKPFNYGTIIERAEDL